MELKGKGGGLAFTAFTNVFHALVTTLNSPNIGGHNIIVEPMLILIMLSVGHIDCCLFNKINLDDYCIL